MALDFKFSRRRPTQIDGLCGIPLFADLNRSELDILCGLLHPREYVAEEVIFDEGEVGHALYLLLDGNVTICRQGQPVGGYLASLGPGEFFGELGLLDRSIRTAQARAASDCRVAVLFREDFNGLMESHLRIAHKIGRQLLSHLGERLRELGLSIGNLRNQ